MRRLALLIVLMALLTGSVAQAASYQKTNGTIVDPIIHNWAWSSHSYSGNNLEPNANLIGAELQFAYLKDADLIEANLAGANLSYADLDYADLDYANLWQADLSNANLRSANLPAVNLTEANLTEANLNYAKGVSANLTKANLTKANLTNALLRYANLLNAQLTNAQLTNANLTEANLEYANLEYANLEYAYLRWANLTGANLTGANLEYANLSEANLNDADLYDVDLAVARDVEYTTGTPYYYGNTVLPGGFDPVAQGWTLAPYCDFTPDAACDVADINQMFEAGDLVTGVAVRKLTDRLDLVDDDTINAADISEWLSQAATANGHSSAYLRGDTDLDRNVDLADYSALANNFDPTGSLGPHGWDHGNSDGDNDVDLADYNVLASNFSPAGYGAAVVPEPTSLCLLLAGLLLLARVRF